MIKKIEFADQYKHPLWQKKRLEIFERDEFTCVNCGPSDRQLHVHHGYYEINKMLWEYDNDTMITVCEKCHKEIDIQKRLLHKKIAKLFLWQWKFLISRIDMLLADKHEYDEQNGQKR